MSDVNNFLSAVYRRAEREDAAERRLVFSRIRPRLTDEEVEEIGRRRAQGDEILERFKRDLETLMEQQYPTVRLFACEDGLFAFEGPYATRRLQ